MYGLSNQGTLLRRVSWYREVDQHRRRRYDFAIQLCHPSARRRTPPFQEKHRSQLKAAAGSKKQRWTHTRTNSVLASHQG